MPVTDSYSDSIEQREDDRCRFLKTKHPNKGPLQGVKGSEVRGKVWSAEEVKYKVRAQEPHQTEPQTTCGGVKWLDMVREHTVHTFPWNCLTGLPCATSCAVTLCMHSYSQFSSQLQRRRERARGNVADLKRNTQPCIAEAHVAATELDQYLVQLVATHPRAQTLKSHDVSPALARQRHTNTSTTPALALKAGCMVRTI